MKLVVGAEVEFLLRAVGWAGYQEDTSLGVGLFMFPRHFRISFL